MRWPSEIKALLAALLLVLVAAVGVKAANEKLDIGISTNEIAITSDFAGADLIVFGALDNADPLLLQLGQYDIIVALEGPPKETVVRKKDRVFGIWINRYSMRFEPAPASYSISSTLPINRITKEIELSGRTIGIEHIHLTPAGNVGDGTRVPEFKSALLRLRVEDGLYQSEPVGVEFVSSSLFRATLRLPASIPVGEHRLRAFLFKNNEFVMERNLRLRVVKTGIEQFVFELAHQQAFLYGLLAVGLAMITGWLASVIFRKD
ncbi:TIGR02186 family protein [Hoeflea sp. TYP-13]|uniref:TIGR02186 family protein n=1 Tax=Hoeflea sp. TYP-13 TaxID=3230023 RepID=UPI0034C64259